MGTIPLYYVGVDYGRYLHLTYLSSIIIYAVALQNKVIIIDLPKNNYFKKFTIKPFVLVFIIFYLNESDSTSFIFNTIDKISSSSIDCGAKADSPGIGFIKVKLVSILLLPSEVVKVIGVEPL